MQEVNKVKKTILVLCIFSLLLGIKCEKEEDVVSIAFCPGMGCEK